jgi:hypothetical protein
VSLIVHFFKKDSRRLRWEIAISLALLAGLIHADRWRSDTLPGAVEGWGNIAIPLVWAFLIGMAVHQDPLVGDRQFWVTSPCPWYALLGAKALFAICWIHIPYLAGCCVVLVARGFSPWESGNTLLIQQLLVLSAVTLPALAIASLVRNIAHFAIALLVAGSGAVYIAQNRFLAMQSTYGADRVQIQTVLLLLALSALAVTVLQFACRKTMLLRIVGASALLTVSLLFALWPQRISALVRSWQSPAPQTVFQLSLSRNSQWNPVQAGVPSYWFHHPGQVSVAIPLDGPARDPEQPVFLRQLSLTITDSRGNKFSAAEPPRGRPQRLPFIANLTYTREPQPRCWQILTLEASLYRRLREGRVRLDAEYMVESRSLGHPVWVDMARREVVPGAGRCASEERDGYGPQQLLLFLCESTGRAPLSAHIRMWQPKTGRDWTQFLGDAASMTPWPSLTWLSPVQRRQTYFQVMPERNDWPGTRRLVAAQDIPGARFEVTPTSITSVELVSVSASDIALEQFVVKPAARR